MTDSDGSTKPKNKLSCAGCLLIVVIGVLVLAIAGPHLPLPKPTDDATEEPSAIASEDDGAAVVERDTPATIRPEAIEPYKASEYPKVVAKWGKTIPAINADRKRAAEIAAQDARCDDVILVQIMNASPRVNRRYYAECENVTRYFFDEKGLNEGRFVDAQTFEDMKKDGLKDW